MSLPWSEVAAHRERLLAIARRRCATREDAEDVVQEAMLRTASFPGLDRARAAAMLTSVTVRLCADLHREAGRRDRALGSLRTIADAAAPGPESLAVAAAERAELDAVVAALPPRQREVLADRAEGLAIPEISARRALTYKAAESALARARAAARAALAAFVAVLAAAARTVRRRRATVLGVPAVAVAVVAAVGGGPVAVADPAPAPRPVPVRAPAVVSRRAPAPPPRTPARRVAPPRPTPADEGRYGIDIPKDETLTKRLAPRTNDLAIPLPQLP